MPLLSSLDKWLRLPSRIALLLGMTALSATTGPDAARAYTGSEPDRVPQQSAKSFGEVLIWLDEGRIYLAEPGKPGEELCLGDTLEARHLRQLLQEHGATAAARRVLLDRMILVGGGGCGFDSTPPERNRAVTPSTRNGNMGLGPARTGNPHQTGPGEKPLSPANAPTEQARAKG